MQLAVPTHERLQSSPQRPRKNKGTFSDAAYLLEVIGHLTLVRIHLDLTQGQVARRAGLSERAIDRAENDGYIPCCNELKAWSAALGLPWEKVWSDCVP
jgi:DNA-binding XRE family transcriptional regulator